MEDRDKIVAMREERLEKVRAIRKDREEHPLKVAIVHDWLVGGGAEKVVLELHRLFPEAPIYTSYATAEWREKLDGKVATGWLQYLGKIRKFIPLLRILWFTGLDFKGYDLVISSSGAEAKGINVPLSTLHVNYCYTPTHYYWGRYDEYMKNPGFGKFDWLARLGLKLFVKPLREWDYNAAQKPDFIFTISTHIQAKVHQYYDRASVVVHPPVDTVRFGTAKPPAKRQGFVITGRQTPYKRVDLAVEACSKLGFPLTVIGNGPEHERLRKLAGKTITFLGHVSDDVLLEELARAKAFIFPCVDDFGIAPVEAMAAGTPVIAYKDGGALDYVVEGKTGTFFDEQSLTSLAKALSDFKSSDYSVDDIKKATHSFSIKQFHKNFLTALNSVLK